MDFSATSYRLVRVGQIGRSNGVKWLSADFNYMVQEPAYVNETLDRLERDEPQIFYMILYVEQPFAYDLEKQKVDVRSVAKRKPSSWTKAHITFGSSNLDNRSVGRVSH